MIRQCVECPYRIQCHVNLIGFPKDMEEEMGAAILQGHIIPASSLYFWDTAGAGVQIILIS